MLKKYLDKISESEYDSYLELQTQQLIADEGIIEGYGFYVKKNPDGYGIRISALNESEAGLMALWNRIEAYLTGKVYFLINRANKALATYIEEKGYAFWHGTYELYYDGLAPEVEKLHFEPYTEKDFDTYIDILGPAFADVRAACNLEPHNWFEANRESSFEDFKVNAERNEIFSLIVDGEIIGVSIIEDHTIELIAIDKSYQGQGYGKKMLRYWMRHLIEEKGYKTISLGMLASNEKALALYVDQGFIVRAGVAIYQNL